MRRRIEPKPGHALFFPMRKRDQVVIGTSVLLWPWSAEEFKHVELGDFRITVQFAAASVNPPAKTADDLPCRIQAVFRLKVNDDGDSLARATRTCSPSKDINTIISHDFFKRELGNKLEALVETAVRQFSYIELLTTPEHARELESAVRSASETNMAAIGFTLLGCRVDVEPIAPNPEALAQNARLKELWDQRLDIKGRVEVEEFKRNNAQEEEKKRELNRSQLAQDVEEKNYQVAKQRIVDAREEELRQLKIADEEGKRANGEEQARISSALQAINDAAQKEKLRYINEQQKLELTLKLDLEQYEQDRRSQLNNGKLTSENERQELESTLKLNREQYEQDRRIELSKKVATHQYNMSQLKREEETKEGQHALQKEQNELHLDDLKAQRAVLQQRILETEKARIETIDKGNAEVERLKMLATHAHTIEMNRVFFGALPAILEKAYVPSEKLGEVKIMYLAGRGTDSGAGTQTAVEQGLGSILSSMSTLPMVREVLKFLSSWDLSMAQAFDRTQEWSDSSKKTIQQGAEKENRKNLAKSVPDSD